MIKINEGGAMKDLSVNNDFVDYEDVESYINHIFKEDVLDGIQIEISDDDVAYWKERFIKLMFIVNEARLRV